MLVRISNLIIYRNNTDMDLTLTLEELHSVLSGNLMKYYYREHIVFFCSNIFWTAQTFSFIKNVFYKTMKSRSTHLLASYPIFTVDLYFGKLNDRNDFKFFKIITVCQSICIGFDSIKTSLTWIDECLHKVDT